MFIARVIAPEEQHVYSHRISLLRRSNMFIATRISLLQRSNMFIATRIRRDLRSVRSAMKVAGEHVAPSGAKDPTLFDKL